MPVTINCEHCGAPIQCKPSHAARTRYCSKHCMYADKRTLPDATCRQCGKVYRPYAQNLGVTFCSADCYTLYRRSLPAEERAALMANATAVIRGSKRSHEDLCKRARTKQERGVLSDDEAEIMRALISRGLYPAPLYAVDKFNVDIAFPSIRLALEYNGGNWHNTDEKREQVARKRAYLEAHGWTVQELPRLRKPRQNDSGNVSVDLWRLVDGIARLVHRLTPVPKV
jgi:very-short-patch-repair endonuclease